MFRPRCPCRSCSTKRSYPNNRIVPIQLRSSRWRGRHRQVAAATAPQIQPTQELRCDQRSAIDQGLFHFPKSACISDLSINRAARERRRQTPRLIRRRISQPSLSRPGPRSIALIPQMLSPPLAIQISHAGVLSRPPMESVRLCPHRFLSRDDRVQREFRRFVPG